MGHHAGGQVGYGVFFSRLRLNGIGVLRIAFELVWAIDAWFKWQPDFVNNFVSYLSGASRGLPSPD